MSCVVSDVRYVREWLSGIASPCQGEGRGFDPRLALIFIHKRVLEMRTLFVYKTNPERAQPPY